MTTVVVIAPVTLVIARVLQVDAVPLLIAEAMLSNVGGIATLVGDPPNILIRLGAGLPVQRLPHALAAHHRRRLGGGCFLLAYLFRGHLARRSRGEAEAERSLSPGKP